VGEQSVEARHGAHRSRSRERSAPSSLSGGRADLELQRGDARVPT
jgi:hypothetical protein